MSEYIPADPPEPEIKNPPKPERASGVSGKRWPSQDPNIPHPGMVFYAGQWRSEDAYERYRKRRHELQRMRLGISADAPVMTSSEMQARSIFMKNLRRATNNKVAMKLIEDLDPRRAKLMRLAVDEGATPFERQRARDALQKHTHVINFEEGNCHRSQTTSAETPTPRLLPKSASF